MDDGHHDAIHFHRVYSLQAVDRCLNHHGTMMGLRMTLPLVWPRYLVHVHYRAPTNQQAVYQEFAV